MWRWRKNGFEDASLEEWNIISTKKETGGERFSPRGARGSWPLWYFGISLLTLILGFWPEDCQRIHLCFQLPNLCSLVTTSSHPVLWLLRLKTRDCLDQQNMDGEAPRLLPPVLQGLGAFLLCSAFQRSPQGSRGRTQQLSPDPEKERFLLPTVATRTAGPVWINLANTPEAEPQKRRALAKAFSQQRENLHPAPLLEPSWLPSPRTWMQEGNSDTAHFWLGTSDWVLLAGSLSLNGTYWNVSLLTLRKLVWVT